MQSLREQVGQLREGELLVGQKLCLSIEKPIRVAIVITVPNDNI